VARRRRSPHLSVPRHRYPCRREHSTTSYLLDSQYSFSMVNWSSAETVAKCATIFSNLGHVCAGAYTLDIFVAFLDYDWAIITRKRPWKHTMVVSTIFRLSYYGSILTDFVIVVLLVQIHHASRHHRHAYCSQHDLPYQLPGPLHLQPILRKRCHRHCLNIVDVSTRFG
jgi:hypothetical protein